MERDLAYMGHPGSSSGNIGSELLCLWQLWAFTVRACPSGMHEASSYQVVSSGTGVHLYDIVREFQQSPH